MNWEIKYKVKGNNHTFGEIVDLHFTDKKDVKAWWDTNRKNTEIDLSKFGITFLKGQRQDKEFISATPIKNE